MSALTTLATIQSALSFVPPSEDVEKLMKPIVKAVEKATKDAAKAAKSEKAGNAPKDPNSPKKPVPENLVPWHNFCNHPDNTKLSREAKSAKWAELSKEEKAAWRPVKEETPVEVVEVVEVVEEKAAEAAPIEKKKKKKNSE